MSLTIKFIWNQQQKCNIKTLSNKIRKNTCNHFFVHFPCPHKALPSIPCQFNAFNGHIWSLMGDFSTSFHLTLIVQFYTNPKCAGKCLKPCPLEDTSTDFEMLEQCFWWIVVHIHPCPHQIDAVTASQLSRWRTNLEFCTLVCTEKKVK